MNQGELRQKITVDGSNNGANVCMYSGQGAAQGAAVLV